jgi:hypothetical protein
MSSAVVRSSQPPGSTIARFLQTPAVPEYMAMKVSVPQHVCKAKLQSVCFVYMSVSRKVELLVSEQRGVHTRDTGTIVAKEAAE